MALTKAKMMKKMEAPVPPKVLKLTSDEMELLKKVLQNELEFLKVDDFPDGDAQYEYEQRVQRLFEKAEMA